MLGHTYKDYERTKEKEERDGNITEEDLTFGEWMKTSPLKSTKVVPERGNEVGGVSKRNIFNNTNLPTVVTH